MASTVNAGSSVGHHLASKVVITVQSFVISSLTYWIVEEYLNNMYLREYISNVFQANGLIIGTLGLLLVAGSMSSLMLVRRRHGEKRFGAISLEINDSTPKIKLAAETNAKPPETSVKPTTDFHPVVAALKADMAERRVSFGSMLGSSVEQPTKVPPANTEIQNRQTPMAGPGSGHVATLPPQRPIPVLQPHQPAGSNVLQTSQPPPPQLPANITTVITGIMPVQKKKDPNAASEEKPASQ